MATSTDSPQILQRLCSGISGASWTLHKSEVSVHVVSYTFIYKGVQLKFKLQHSGTWVAAAWPPYHLYCHPAVLFFHVCLIARILKMLLQFLKFFLKMHNLKLCKVGCVYTVHVNGDD